VSHLVISTRAGLSATPAIGREAALTALGVLAQHHVYDTGPHGSERLLVVETGSLAAIQAMAARGAR
jgi:hypothetical protein